LASLATIELHRKIEALKPTERLEHASVLEGSVRRDPAADGRAGTEEEEDRLSDGRKKPLPRAGASVCFSSDCCLSPRALWLT